MDSYSHRLRQAVAEEEPRLRAISDSAAGARSGEAWSAKQELGHLVDSATNNRVRFIRAVIEDQFSGPGYEQRKWVDLGGYADMPWPDLLDLWKALNLALATVVDRIPPERLPAKCRVSDVEVTLEFLVDDYIRHLQHHLDHILSRERLTTYPGAALNV
jgi:hypothetical protein